MANVKISALPAATSVAAADTLPIVQSATTKKATFQNVIDSVVSNEPGTSFRNRIINGDFSVNQRGFTSTTTPTTYGFDRWRNLASGGTVTYSSQAFTLGNAITGQEPANFARLVTSSQSAAGDLGILEQPIEGVRTFAGQTITISFWAKAGSGTPKVAVEVIQNFGTGGSPSATVNSYAGQVTLSTSWVRYSVTFNVPSISGKTLGTANDALNLYLWVSGGSNWNSRNGSLGIQNNTFDFWGVQVEAGSTASAFERRPQQVELALCQRYYYRRNFTVTGEPISTLHCYSATAAYGPILDFPVVMRAVPTVGFSARSDFLATSAAASSTYTWASGNLGASTKTCYNAGVQFTSAAFTAGHATIFQSANGNAWLDFSAEL